MDQPGVAGELIEWVIAIAQGTHEPLVLEQSEMARSVVGGNATGILSTMLKVDGGLEQIGSGGETGQGDTGNATHFGLLAGLFACWLACLAIFMYVEPGRVSGRMYRYSV